VKWLSRELQKSHLQCNENSQDNGKCSNGEITWDRLQVPSYSNSQIQSQKLMFMMKIGLNTYKRKTEEIFYV